jgi:hypothetical protein
MDLKGFFCWFSGYFQFKDSTATLDEVKQKTIKDQLELVLNQVTATMHPHNNPFDFPKSLPSSNAFQGSL